MHLHNFSNISWPIPSLPLHLQHPDHPLIPSHPDPTINPIASSMKLKRRLLTNTHGILEGRVQLDGHRLQFLRFATHVEGPVPSFPIFRGGSTVAQQQPCHCKERQRLQVPWTSQGLGLICLEVRIKCKSRLRALLTIQTLCSDLGVNTLIHRIVCFIPCPTLG